MEVHTHNRLTLRREVGVKLTPDSINCLMTFLFLVVIISPPQNSFPCNSFYCLDHPKNVYDYDDDDDHPYTTASPSVAAGRASQWQLHDGAGRRGGTGLSTSWPGPPNLAALKLRLGPPNLAVLLTHCGQLFLEKLVKLMPPDVRY